MEKSRRQRRRVSEAKNKNYTNHTPGGRKLHKWSVSGTSSQESEANDLTSQAWGVGEDVPASLHYAVARKKRLRLLSEERLSPRSTFA